MKNRLADLNNHLFAQMERLTEEDQTPDQIDQEIKRTSSIVALAGQIVDNADLQLKAAKLYAEHGASVLPMLPQIGPRDVTPPRAALDDDQ
ncbi:hypothetical protein O4H61_03455 [Roseovarius aestuarii]|nr:hypothetical protein [Roseovarius aestuarii]